METESEVHCFVHSFLADNDLYILDSWRTDCLQGAWVSDFQPLKQTHSHNCKKTSFEMQTKKNWLTMDKSPWAPIMISKLKVMTT